jgi:putative ABC transport system permease protein
MLRNYVVTALRNLARNWLYGAISIAGLAVAFAVALLIGQFVRNEFSYDRWLPGYQQVYKLTDVLQSPGQPAMKSDITQSALANQMRVALPGVTAARLDQGRPPVRHRSGDAGVDERSFAWADPDFFKVFPLPVLAGNLDTALQQPDTVVITRRMARKYFGRDLPIGDFLQVQAATPPPPGSPPPAPGSLPWHAMRVTAVLADLPSNTNLTAELFGSSRSAYSILSFMDVHPSLGNISTYTFVRLAPKQTGADLQRVLPIVSQPEDNTFKQFTPGSKYAFGATPLSEAHLTAPGLSVLTAKPTGSRPVAYAIAGVGALIVLVAAINFVTLMTARAARRGLEVGIRKATGAQRTDLMVQFIGEALIQVALAALIAVGLAEALVRPFSAFVQRELAIDFIHDPALLGAVALAVLTIGFLAAIYPAMVLSSFRPAVVLKGGLAQASGSPVARQALVVIQFAILVGLIVTTITLYRQTTYALDRGLGAADSQLIVRLGGGPCASAFPDEVRKLPGVAGAVCSSINALNTGNAKNIVDIRLGAGRRASFDVAPVDFGFFEFYGVRPVAGRLFARDHGEDQVLTNLRATAMPTVIINETAARVLGFPHPGEAVGKALTWTRYLPPAVPTPNAQPIPMTGGSRIIGIVPDIPVTVAAATDPTFYFVQPQSFNMLSVKMTGKDMPGTAKAIAATWKRIYGAQPMVETTLAQSRLTLYLDLIIQGVTIGICALLAVVIACLGLFALSAYTTERRTKEIGVRKAMGADTLQVVLLLLWQFTIPVLVAIAVALPIGFAAMSWWLHGFVYHVELSILSFVLAAVTAVAIAWATVSWQSFVVARAKPASALRYE